MKLMWISSGFLAGLATLSIAMASVPTRGRVTDDTAIYQKLSEIRVAKQALPDLDQDIANLSASEGRYREKLPSLSAHPSLKGPMSRVASKPYRYSGKPSKAAKR